MFVRVRPLAEGEAGPDDIKYGSLYAFHKANGESSELELVEKPGAGIGGYGESKERKRHGFNFQKVFAPNTSQEGVFEEVETLVSAALEGHRVCIFAYGQTGRCVDLCCCVIKGLGTELDKANLTALCYNLQKNECLSSTFAVRLSTLQRQDVHHDGRAQRLILLVLIRRR